MGLGKEADINHSSNTTTVVNNKTTDKASPNNKQAATTTATAKPQTSSKFQQILKTKWQSAAGGGTTNSCSPVGEAKSRDEEGITPRAADLSLTRGTDDVTWASNGKNHSTSVQELRLGSMRVKQSPMSILLVFPSRCAQCDALSEAAELRGYDCDAVYSTQDAVHYYMLRNHSVVIVDTRPFTVGPSDDKGTKDFDPEGLCRLLRATHNSEFTVMIAVRPSLSSPSSLSHLLSQQNHQLDTSMSSLLSAGFNRQFIENSSVVVCQNELMCLEMGEVAVQSKLKAAQALLTAVEHSSEAVEITNEQLEIQYVNAMFERLSGYTRDELEGKKLVDMSPQDPGVMDTVITDAVAAQVNKGKTWDGLCHIRRKDGERLTQKCRVIPVHGQSGKIRHFVSIRSPTIESFTDPANFNISGYIGGHNSARLRKESVVRLKSMSVETPLTKVIYMINSLRDSSPSQLADSLDKVLDVLRSSELYHPNFSQQVKDDKTTSDLVGGLMTSLEEESIPRRRISSAKRPSCTSELNITLKTHRESHASVHPIMVTSEVEQLLDDEAKWDFNIIELERLTEKRPLIHLAMRTLQRFGVCEFLSVDEAILFNWLQLVESNYHPSNPYHNSTHAADVMHATAYFLSCDRIKNVLDPVDEVAALLSAIVHDLDHPGKTNTFLVNAGADVSILYNDLAVLESHHVSTAYRLTLKSDKVNIFKNLSRDDYKMLRQQIVDMVLATEMTKHFEHLNRFVSVVDQDEDETDLTVPEDSTASNLRAGEARILIKRMLIKCADISNPARPLALCKEWASRIATEYCNQTEEEKERGLPVVMPVFDKKNCNIAKSQISFVDLFIKDMFAAWNNFCHLPEVMDMVHDNYLYWKEQEASSSRRTSEPVSSNST